MAQYKVPQDVEADDKLLGPFSFRQFVYLLIAGGGIALAVFLAQLFPLLAIIPVPIILFFLILALPIKKDQPMETYLAALVSFYLKPHKRFWIPGQRESTIEIIAPKKVEEPRAREITEQEAGHRLSFLADLIDSEGRSIRNETVMKDDFAEEAENIVDMFDSGNAAGLGQRIYKDNRERHDAVVAQMKNAIEKENNLVSSNAGVSRNFYNNTNIISNNPAKIAAPPINNQQVNNFFDQIPTENVVVMPAIDNTEKREPVKEKQENPVENSPKQSIIELANNKDFSVETIQKQANRIKKEEEVYISLR